MRKATGKQAADTTRPRVIDVDAEGHAHVASQADDDADPDANADADDVSEALFGDAAAEVFEVSDDTVEEQTEDASLHGRDDQEVLSEADAAEEQFEEGPLELLPARAPRKRRSSAAALSTRDPLDAYMAEVRRFPLLSPEEEHRLATRLVEHGDSAAARKLVEANLRLVVKIAYEYRRAHRNLLDLVQEGNIGLMQAVSKYDPYRGVKLSSYAAFWIRAYILKFVLNNWRLVKIGTTQAQRKLFFNLRKERAKLEQLGFRPTPALLADKLDVTEQEVIEMERRLEAPEASLDAPLGGDDDGGMTRLDAMASPDERPDHAVANAEFGAIVRAKLEQFAQTLEGRDAHIFRERWLSEEPQTLQEIGDKYGVSRERARQLEKRMLDKLRTFLEQELGSVVDIGALSRE